MIRNLHAYHPNESIQIYLNYIMMKQSQDKESLSLWIGNQSQNLAYSYYHLAAEQIFDEEDDPINHHTIFKDINKRKPRMLVLGTEIERLKQVREVDHKKMIRKIKKMGNNELAGMQGYFSKIDTTGIMNYGGEKPEQDQDKQEKWAEFTNWTDSQNNYVLVDTNHTNPEYNSSKSRTKTQYLSFSYEQHQEYYLWNQQNIENTVRKQLEQCDYLKFFTFCCDQPYQGLMVKVLQNLSDQCPKLPKIVSTLASNKYDRESEFLVSIPTFSQIYQLCDMYIPIDSPQKYYTFQLEDPELYDKKCQRRLAINMNLAPLFHMIYTPLNMKGTNVDSYLASVVLDNRKLFNVGYSLPIIRNGGALGPVNEENQKYIGEDQGVFPYEKAIRNIWDSKIGKNTNTSNHKPKNYEQKQYPISFTNESYLALGPQGDYLAESFIFKGHFNNFQKLLLPKCESLSVKYLEGIFACPHETRLAYTSPNPLLKSEYRSYYPNTPIQSFPYQSVLFNHESFGANIRYGLELVTKNSSTGLHTNSGSGKKLLKIFNENVEEWVNNCYQIADKYYQNLNITEDD